MKESYTTVHHYQVAGNSCQREMKEQPEEAGSYIQKSKGVGDSRCLVGTL
jgi:hypothetical protein